MIITLWDIIDGKGLCWYNRAMCVLIVNLYFTQKGGNDFRQNRTKIKST